jgi:hypothetical protein
LVKTFFSQVYTNFETGYGATYTGRVFYNDPFGDPTQLDARVTQLRYWVHARLVRYGLGIKRPTVFQFDIYQTTGVEGTQSPTTGFDQYGHQATDIVADLVSAFSPSDSGVLIKDYTVTPLTPTNTTEWYIIRNSRGQWGHPEEVVRLHDDRGLIRDIATYHVWHHQDLEGQPVYF